MHPKRILTAAGRAAVVAVAAAALTACDVVVSSVHQNGKAQDEWSRTYPITPTGQIEVINTNGLVEIIATDGAQVEVRAERMARANTDEAAQELLKAVQIKEDVGPDRVRLETAEPRGSGFGRSGQVKYHIKVPAGVSVHVRNTNGQIRVEGVRGSVRAETTNGGVRGRDLSGAVEASTTNGGVDIELNELAAEGVTATTTNGGVELSVPENVKADIKATCVHGGVSVSGLTVDGETRRNLVQGTVNGGGPRIALSTTNGGVRVRAGSSAH